MKHHSKGFTLIELMIVVAIAAILAGIVYPNYTAYVQRTRRADAMSALMAASASLERYRSTNRFSYVGASLTGGGGTVVFTNQVPVEGGTAYYNITLDNLTATTFRLTATPTGVQPVADGVLTINQAGQKSWGANACWPTTQGSGCP